MAWRKQTTHREETKAVKAALKAAGINAYVGHGNGTAWGWLHANIGAGQDFGEHDRDSGETHFCRPGCPRCKGVRALSRETLRILQEVTGRHGDYNGNINIYTQDEWNKKLGRSVPIPQDPARLKELVGIDG